MYSKSRLEEDLSAQKLLFEGCRELDYHKVESAVHSGADVNALASYSIDDRIIDTPTEQCKELRYSPLSLVAMHGKIDIPSDSVDDSKATKIAALLVQHGAKIDTLDIGDMGNSPLHWAIATLKTELCEYLIQEAIRTKNNVINLPGQSKSSRYPSTVPLIQALKSFSEYQVYQKYGIAIPELLINADADVNVVDHYQQSALHLAAILRLPISFFRLLVEKGANYSPNAFNKTPKQLYEMELTYDLIDTGKYYAFSESHYHLLSYGNLDARLIVAERFRRYTLDKAVVELLDELEQSYRDQLKETTDNLPLNQQDEMGRTRLHWAVFYGKCEEFEKLLNVGADITIKDNAGLTALELAQSLQQKFTYKVSPTFFSGIETAIKASNCAVWNKFEEILSERSLVNTL